MFSQTHEEKDNIFEIFGSSTQIEGGQNTMSTGYLIDHPKSNMKLSPQHPHWSRHYERLGLGSQKKEIRHWHLAFWDHVESPLIFLLQKKITIIYNLHI